ncbi:MAG: hypothetical protein O3C43_03910 [Verrucomicrobia bacterium]|nr:hypothetical protein [Verrucomicrobiota bacterium]MDA1065627.1 hypothetical protein [Verrucomicrobiota bacterium]
MKSKLTLGVLIAVLSCASLSGNMISLKSDRVMELSVFNVYAPDSKETKNNSFLMNSNWKFQKSLDFNSEPDFITVVGPGEESHSIPTPSIKTTLVNTSIENS